MDVNECRSYCCSWPWGVSYAANITLDETGIGNWAFKQFKIALREGKYKGQKTRRDLLPPMPWQNYANMTDGDIKTIFLYLKNTASVKNEVPPPIPPNLSNKVAAK